MKRPDTNHLLFAGLVSASPAAGPFSGSHLAVLSESGRVTDLVFLETVPDMVRYLRRLQPAPVCLALERGSSGFSADTVAAEIPGLVVCETESEANQDRLLTEDVVLPVSLLQGRAVRSHHAAFLGAVLCAVAARRYLARQLEGDPVPGSAPDRRTIPFHALDDPFRDYTLCLVVQDDSILLGMKKRGLGEGYWNGFGGKIEIGETPFEAASRELHEESGLTAPHLTPAGMLYFTFEDGTPPMRGFVFRVDSFGGAPAESQEMRPQWFALSEIPYERMWADDVFWLPLLLEGRPFSASFHVQSDRTIGRRSLVETTDILRIVEDYGKRRRPERST